MCQVKGKGPRCHSHQLKLLVAAQKHTQLAIASGDPTKIAEAQAAEAEAKHAYKMTPTVTKALEEAGLVDEANQLRAERAALVEAYKRENSAFEDEQQNVIDLAARKELLNTLNINAEPSPRIVAEKPTKKLTAAQLKRIEENRLKQEARIAELQEELANKVAHLHEDGEWQNYLDTMTQFHNYSPTNRLLISLQNPDATLVASYTTWQKLGRHIVRGNTAGIYVFAPKKAMVPQYNKDKTPKLDADGNQVKVLTTVGFKTVAVYDVSQTDGKPLPTYGELTETPPPGFQEDLETAVKDAGFTVRYEPISGSTQGFTTADGTKKVVVDSSLSPAKRAAVLAHELGHIKAGHLERIDEYHQGHDGHRGSMEAEAESISYVLCRSNGMSTKLSEGAASYINGWTKGDNELAVQAQASVSKALGELFKLNWRNKPLL